ncbi:MAG: hypothetical protein N3B12_04080, partial [Armatimonadetes bacterium]|nr:hypothetical protein [Armatimonadota bacterium]
MTSRERIYAALEGREVDTIPVAPLFWGAEYGWKLTGLPLWEVLHGPGDMGMKVLEAIEDRHHPDWVIPTHGSSHRLEGKTYSHEDQAHVYFIDNSSGEEWVFHKEGHWLLPKSQIGKARMDHQGANIDPPRNKAEADEWLKRTHPHLDPPSPPLTEEGNEGAMPQDEPNSSASQTCEQEASRVWRKRFPDKFLVGSVHPVFAGLAYSMG